MSNAFYHLEQLATRQCEHGRNTVGGCTRRPVSAAVRAYLDKKKRMPQYANAIVFNPEWKPDASARSRERYRWVEYPERGLRLVGKSHEVTGRRGNYHTGWYVDSFQSETTCGVVYQLPARNGAPRYVPGNTDPCSDAAVLDFHSITDDKEECARWADSMAERYAEESRDAERADRAEQRIAEIAEEIESAYERFREITRELKTNAPARAVLASAPKLAELVRRERADVRREVRKLRTERERIQRNGIEE